MSGVQCVIDSVLGLSHTRTWPLTRMPPVHLRNFRRSLAIAAQIERRVQEYGLAQRDRAGRDWPFRGRIVVLHSYAHVVMDTVQAQATVSPAFSLVGGLAGYVLSAFALWGMLGKAGLPKWGGFVPFYNLYLTVKMAGYNGWMFLLFLIPVVNFVWGIFVALRLGKAFGKGGAFSFFLMWLLAIIGYFVCSYDQSTYRHPETGTPAAA